MSSLLLSLLGHMRWADALVSQSLARAAPRELESERLFAHIAAAEHLWWARIQGRRPDHAVWPALSVDQARELAATHADLFEQLVAGSDEAALDLVIEYRNSAGREFRNTVAEIVTHVAMHGSYHRGQIARQLRAAGQEPPYTDYIQYIRRDQVG